MSAVKLFIGLLLPIAIIDFFGLPSLLSVAVDLLFVSACVIILYGINSRSKFQQFVKLMVMLIYVAVLFFTFLETMIYRFAGHGFTHEVFFHLSWESFEIGLAQYGVHLAALCLLIVIVVAAIFFLTRHIKRLQLRSVLVGVAVLALLVPFTSVGRFISGWAGYSQSSAEISDVDDGVVQFLTEQGYVNHEPYPLKQFLVAEAPSAQNLVLVYLESFNQFLLDQAPHNQLTPGLQALGQKYQTFQHESSAYVTIEGIAASLCGTLLPMQSGNSSFMPGSGYLENLPCLSDVLSAAGYEQYYLGGAVLEFAGKGHFLKTHGYDDVRGMAYWQEKGLESKKSFWGLSDADLFDQAIKTIEQAKSPYNLTLLTLGTHIPGFTYRGCPEPNDNEDVFISAIRCTDYLVERFVNELEAKGLLEDTLLVIVADHGVFPNPDMKKLFDELVYDRRLVGMTNYQGDLAGKTMATYDLAPTVLDWLGVKTNAKFLFGQSIEDENHNHHKHVTRYGDWHAGELVRIRAKDCKRSEHNNILNACDFDKLVQWTMAAQSKFMKSQYGDELGCELNIKVNLTEEEKQLSINGRNYYNQFHHNGFMLSKRQFETGHFIFGLDQQNRIVNQTYIPLDRYNQEAVKSAMNQVNVDWILVIEVQQSELVSVSAHHPNDQQSSTIKQGTAQRIELCNLIGRK